MKDVETYKRLPNTDTHNCFGCSPINPSGLQMKFFTDEQTVFTKVTVPDHLCGWNSVIHGGVLTTMLDEIMSWTAMYLLKSITMTRSMEIEFLKPAFVGSPLAVEGKVSEVERQRNAYMEGYIYNGEGELCAKSTGKFALFTPALAKRMKLMDKVSLEWFENVISGVS